MKTKREAEKKGFLEKMVFCCIPIPTFWRMENPEKDRLSNPAPAAYLNSIGVDNKSFTRRAMVVQMIISVLILILTISFMIKSAHNFPAHEQAELMTSELISENSGRIAVSSIAALILFMSLIYLIGEKLAGNRLVSIWTVLYFVLSFGMIVTYIYYHDFLGTDGTFLVSAGIFVSLFFNLILVRVVADTKELDQQNLV